MEITNTNKQLCDPDFTKYDNGEMYLVPLPKIVNPFRTIEKKTKEIPIHTIFITFSIVFHQLNLNSGLPNMGKHSQSLQK